MPDKVLTMLRRIAAADSWQNIQSGFGGNTTPAALTYWQARRRLTYAELNGLYTQNWLIAAVVNSIPEDATRRWLQLTSREEPEAAEVMTKEFKRLDVRGVFQRAHVNARLFGGAAIVLGAFDGQQVDQPLNVQRVRSVLYLNVVNRWRCQPIRWYSDPSDIRYGEVSHYLVTDQKQTYTRSSIVHESRLIIWPGEYVTDDERLRQNGWGGTVVERTYEPIRDYGITMESIGNVVQDFVTTTLKVSGLRELIANDDWDTIEARLVLMAQNRSGHNMALVGEDEEMTKAGTPISGIGDIIANATRDLCGAVGIPETRLFSSQGGNLNSDGGAGADLRNYYDSVATAQTTEYTPRLQRLMEVLGAPTAMETDEIEIEFLPLWEPTAKERAEEYKILADADAVYIQNGVVSPDEVRATRFGGLKFNTGSIALQAELPDVAEPTEAEESEGAVEA